MTEQSGRPDSENEITPEQAELYDLDCADYGADLIFYQSLAAHQASPVLELGVGTGRVAIPLAQAGLDVWGIDASKSMLARAKCRAQAEELESLHLLHGKMEQFELEQLFGLIYAAFGTLHLLLTTEQQLACFHSVEQHLLPGGIFVCDLRPLHFEDWEEGESAPLFHDWTRTLPRTTETVMKFRTIRSDLERGVKEELTIFDTVSDVGVVRRTTYKTEFKFFGRDELESLLRRAGLRVEGVYGGYAREDFDERGDHMVVLARTLKGAQ